MRRLSEAQDRFTWDMACELPGHTQTLLPLYNAEGIDGSTVSCLKDRRQEARIWLQREGYLIVDEGPSRNRKHWWFTINRREAA